MSPELAERITSGLARVRAAPRERPDADVWGRGPLPSRELAPSVLAADGPAVFDRAWLPLAREQDLPTPGSWRRVEVGARRWLLARGADGRAHLHANVCPHRASLLVSEASGSGACWRCPYHGLVWELDGALRSDPRAFGFHEDAPCPGHLTSYRVEAAAGWLWGCADPAAPPLGQGLGPEVVDLWSAYGLDRLAVAHRHVVEARFSWRLGIQGFLEPLHVPLIHPRTIGTIIQGFQRGDMLAMGEHSVMFVPWRLPDAFQPTGALGRVAAAAGVESFPGLGRVELGTNFVLHVFPNLILNFMPTHVTVVQMWPLPSGRTRVVHELLVAPTTTEPQRAFWDELVPGYLQLLQEDLVNLERVQEGLEAGVVDAMPLSWYERRLRHFHAALGARHRAWQAEEGAEGQGGAAGAGFDSPAAARRGNLS